MLVQSFINVNTSQTNMRWDERDPIVLGWDELYPIVLVWKLSCERVSRDNELER